jgi:hypothetical protein
MANTDRPVRVQVAPQSARVPIAQTKRSNPCNPEGPRVPCPSTR